MRPEPTDFCPPAGRSPRARALLPFFAAVLFFGLTRLEAQTPSTPEAFFGHPVGADYHLTTYEKAMEWFEHLAENSGGRMRVLEMGETGMGKVHRYGVISSAENMARLDEYRETARRLSLGRGLGPEEAQELASAGKGIAWIDVGLHSTEAAPSEHVLQLAYDLVTDEDPRTRRIRDELITLLVFPNPDGMTMVAEWYMDHVGTEFEESRMPWLYNRYIGHDNNRDSYNVTQKEVRNVSRLQNQEWFPNVVYNHHQTAPFPTRIWIPPYGEPVNPNKPGEVIRWENLIGAAMGMAFDAEGKPGAVSSISFDAWYPGFMTQVVTHHNIPSILTETALYYLATPHEYSLEDIPPAWRDFQKSGFYTTPWEGGWWRIGDAVEYCLTASKAVLDVTARYREDMLLSKYRLARANIDRFEEEAPYGWALPLDQADPTALLELMDKMKLLGIEVFQAEEALEAGNRTLPPETIVIPTSQAFGGFVKTLFERQAYPDLREKTHLWQGIPRRIDVDGGPLRPYDVAGWTLSLQMGLDAAELHRPASELDLKPFEDVWFIRPTDHMADREWYLFPSDGGGWRTVNHLLARGVTVGVETAGDGRFVVEAGHGADLKEVFLEMGRVAKATAATRGSGGPAADVQALSPFRVAVYRPWQGSMDEGWLRWILEHNDFQPTQLGNDRVRAGGLAADFDAIVLPSVRARSILEGNREGSVPAEYVGGIGEEGLEALKAFAREGGTLFFHEGSTDLALQAFDLPLAEVSGDARESGFYSAGSILRFSWDPTSGLTRGMDSEGVAFVSSRTQLFEVSGEPGNPAGRPRVVGSFPEEGPLLLSGYLEGETALHGKAPVVEVPYGEGRLVLV
ncbi:MAG: hypothetical protein KJN92_15125, partial [Gemmatimonadetes bacterium]|nr:hypothetical protein [Gemmatimonadota bacterium]